jgi:hypothetical protein
VAGAPVPVSQKRLAFWAFHAQQCLEFTENGERNKKHPVSGSPVGENSWLVRGVEGKQAGHIQVKDMFLFLYFTFI